MDDTTRVGRYGGGSYRRGGRWYRSTICRSCVDGLLRSMPTGDSVRLRHCTWSVAGIQQAAAEFGLE